MINYFIPFRCAAAALAAAACFFISGCSEKTEGIRTGDLLFVGYPEGFLNHVPGESGGMADAIAASTGKGGTEFVHTAILEATDSGIFVIDATIKYGVDRHPLDTLIAQFTLSDGSLPELVVMRLKDPSKAEEHVANAKKYIGEEYDSSFMAGNGKHYCTELVYDSYTGTDGEPLLQCVPMNFKGPDGEFPPYWVWLFDLIGEPIPQDEPGTNPQEMIGDPALRPVKFSLPDRR